ncbi:50S ribosomal protein L24, partial [Candidatus Parcubacteria bacterium]|nr:50S ribosomal protein L24 [Candidatus Parcubacteria bacterium]
MKIKKGDKVKIISGKARGRESTVSAAWPSSGRILVEGV